MAPPAVRPHSWARRLVPHLVAIVAMFAAAWQQVDAIHDVEAASGPFALWTLGLSTALGAIYLAWSNIADRPELLLCCVLAVAGANAIALPRLWSLTNDDALPFPGTFVLISLTILPIQWIIAMTLLLPLHAVVVGAARAIAGKAHGGEAILGGLVLSGWIAIAALAVCAVELDTSPMRTVIIVVMTVLGISDEGWAVRHWLWLQAAATAATAALLIAWFRLAPTVRASVRKLPIGYYLPADKTPPHTDEAP